MSATPQPRDFVHRRVLRDLRTDLEVVQREVEAQLKQRRYEDSAQWAIKLALEEAISNAFRHGNKNDPAKSVHFSCAIGDQKAEFTIEDEGPGFNPDAVPDPTEEENIEIPSGRGIMLIRAYMTDVEYLEPGNRLRMIYRRG
jgi:serine/threonine-protein kinase RsbW